ncbi:MAG: hypothetical protein V4691_03785 [Pseudomonadota bacterium]
MLYATALSSSSPLNGGFFKWVDKIICERVHAFQNMDCKKHGCTVKLTLQDVTNYYSTRSEYNAEQFDHEFRKDGTLLFGSLPELISQAKQTSVSRQDIANAVIQKMRDYAKKAKDIPGAPATKSSGNDNNSIHIDEYRAAKFYIKHALKNAS